ncbi:helix-turn-helix domain-containing protein [Baekduia soli]|uniref:Helix-turn-helix domain-containing protein n=1 Tax=Baekduia soli TaxID=496014 RepID=A0A5B8UBU4_9ACTN|nr:helix-turn-helix domain-containing protein [Baekduia soli]QEC50454.1 helix-turn-helix domain-containing protein [Baekduia soli]
MQTRLAAEVPLTLQWPAPLMTATEVAAVLRITAKTVRQHIRRGKLRAIQLDGGRGSYRVSAEDAQAWAEAQLVQPDAGALAVDRLVADGRRRRIGRVGP